MVFRCKDCYKLEAECIPCERTRLDYMAGLAHEHSEDCGREDCQECCQHDERDHGICLDCAHEQDPGEAIDRAMDSLEDR